MYQESWLERIKREFAERQISKPKTLEDEIREWWYNLPEVEKFPYYTMGYLGKIFRYPSRQIGPALCSLGWRRSRLWKPGKPFFRIWVPPESM